MTKRTVVAATARRTTAAPTSDGRSSVDRTTGDRSGGTRADGARSAPAAVAPSRSNGQGPRASAIGVLQQFRELFRLSQQHFQRIEAACGVSGAQLWTLSEICRAPGQSVSQLAGKLSVHLSTASNLAGRLERQGFVRRRRSAADQRSVCLYATALGKRVLARAPAPVEGLIPDALHRLPAAALTRLHADLDALLSLTASRDPAAGLEPLSE